MAYYCYLMQCANGAYYTGWTKDPIRREKEHNAGRGSRYTRMNGPVRLVYAEEQPDWSSALKRERQLKKLTHAAKAALVLDTTQNLAATFLEPPNDPDTPNETL